MIYKSAIKKLICTVLIFGISVNMNVFASEKVQLEELQAAINAMDLKKAEELIMTDNSDIIENTVDVDVTVDENNILTETSTLLVGASDGGRYDWLFNEDMKTLNDDYLAIIDDVYDIPIFRCGLPGNATERLKFPEDRTADTYLEDINLEMYRPDVNYSSAPHGTGSGTEGKGAAAFLQALKVNPDCKFFVIVDIECSRPEDTANVVRFCRDPNGSSEWAKLRASWGIENPINLIGIEMGNEKYFFSTPTPELAKSATDWYIETFKKHYEAVKAVDPNIELLPTINSNSTRGGFYEWNRPVLAALYEYVNIISFHLYYSGYELAYTYQWIQDTLDLIEEVSGGKKIKFAFTEHGTWETRTYTKRQGLQGILPTAQFYNRMIKKDYMHSTNAFCYTHTGWAFVRKQDDGTLQPTGMNYMHAVYEKNLGDRVYDTLVESDSPLTDEMSTAQRFTVLATAKGDNQLKIFICNREPYTDFNVNFKFNNNYTLVEETVFTAPNIYSLVYSENTKDVFTTTVTPKNEPNFSSYKMPSKSLVVLTLETKSKLPRLGEAADSEEVTYDGEKKFIDLEGYWAENEIYNLSDAGIVNGVSADAFSPDTKVTRGDFALLLYRTIKKDKKVSNFEILDVGFDSPYYEAVNYLVNMGVIRLDNNKFNLNAPISVIDAASMIYRADKTADKKAIDMSQRYDASDLTDWQKDVLNYQINGGVLRYFYETKVLEPSKLLTRGEAASIIFRVFNNIEKY
ncbi:MAG: hypothetical protein E7404_03810 [Ruminococcaceae bacterium]|nr:hypothetical protein [Oscillospiraceae bacterium]